MKSSLPSSAMDSSIESSTSCTVSSKFHPAFSLKDIPIPNIDKLLPNFHPFEHSGAINRTIKPAEFNNSTPKLFPVSAVNNHTVPHSTNAVSNLFKCITSRTNAPAAKQNPWLRFGKEIGQRIEECKACLGSVISDATTPRQRVVPCFASVSAGGQESWEPKSMFQLALSTEYVAKTLEGVPVYTVSNANNEFVLVSDPDSSRSLGLLCFRQQDAEALLAQVQLRQPLLSRGAKVVPIPLEKVYTLKVEGIAFRFLPDPVQVKNALQIKSKDLSNAFDGVPVFQSDRVVITKNNRRLYPLYFCKEDLERELIKILKNQPKASQLSSDILVGSLEGILKKMEESKNRSGWDDVVFIPPGKSSTEHIQKVLV